jgi:hypothetical protein
MNESPNQLTTVLGAIQHEAMTATAVQLDFEIASAQAKRDVALGHGMQEEAEACNALMLIIAGEIHRREVEALTAPPPDEAADD